VAVACNGQEAESLSVVVRDTRRNFQTCLVHSGLKKIRLNFERLFPVNRVSNTLQSLKPKFPSVQRSARPINGDETFIVLKPNAVSALTL
jgi:hypothetical protein